MTDFKLSNLYNDEVAMKNLLNKFINENYNVHFNDELQRYKGSISLIIARTDKTAMGRFLFIDITKEKNFWPIGISELNFFISSCKCDNLIFCINDLSTVPKKFYNELTDHTSYFLDKTSKLEVHHEIVCYTVKTLKNKQFNDEFFVVEKGQSYLQQDLAAALILEF